jgi:hypothetical protein
MKGVKQYLMNHSSNHRYQIPTSKRYVRGENGVKKLHCEGGVDICFDCGNVYHANASCES